MQVFARRNEANRLFPPRIKKDERRSGMNNVDVCAKMIRHTLAQESVFKKKGLTLKGHKLWDNLSPEEQKDLEQRYPEYMYGAELSFKKGIKGVLYRKNASIFTLRVTESDIEYPKAWITMTPVDGLAEIKNRAICPATTQSFGTYKELRKARSAAAGYLLGDEVYILYVTVSPNAAGNMLQYPQECIVFVDDNESPMLTIDGYWNHVKNKSLRNFIYSSGASIVQEVLKEKEPGKNFTRWHLAELKRTGAPFSGIVETQMAKRTLQPDFWKAESKTLENLKTYTGVEFEDDIRVLSAQIVESVQKHLDSIAEKMVRFVYQSTYSTKPSVVKTLSVKELVRAINALHKDQPLMRPRIFLNNDFSEVMEKATWIKDTQAVYPDSGLRLKFPFEIHTAETARFAAEFLAASMIDAELPLPLYYAGAKEL